MQTWREEDGWHLRVTGGDDLEDKMKEPFATSGEARRAFKFAAAALADARFEILDARPEDLDDD